MTDIRHGDELPRIVKAACSWFDVQVSDKKALEQMSPFIDRIGDAERVAGDILRSYIQTRLTPPPANAPRRF